MTVFVDAPQRIPRRNRWAFRLRTLLIVFTLIIIACGLFAVYVQPYREERLRWEQFRHRWGEGGPFFSDGPMSAHFAGDESVPWLLREAGGASWFGVVQSVSVDHHEWSEELISDLAEFRHLESLALIVDDVGAPALSQLNRLPRLKSLTLRGQIAGRDLARLRNCRRLRTLDLRETDCSLEDVKVLEDQPLELIYVSFPWTEDVFRSGRLAQRIVPLSPLRLTGLNEGGVSKLAELNYWKNPNPGTFALTLRDSRLSSADVDVLCALPVSDVHLQRVQLAPAQQLRLMQGAGRTWRMRADRETISIKSLADTFGPTAREAKVGAARILLPDLELRWDESLTDAEWADFYARVPQLESLEVDITLSADLLEHWSALPKLRTLQFYVDAFREPEVHRLRTAPALESLTIYHGALHPAHWEFLREMPRLRELVLWNFGREDIDPAALKTIAAAPGLTQLTLAYWRPRDEHLAALAAAKQLRRLEIRGIGDVTAEGRLRLQADLPELELRVK